MMLRLGVGVACVAGLMLAGSSAETGKSDGWIDLFNGKSLSGWKVVGNGTWTVEDGILIGTQNDKGEPGDLMTRLQYSDFELEVEFKVVWPANSGIWFRMPPGKRGYQYDILNYPEAKTGSIWAEGFKTTVKHEEHLNKNDWNTATIRCVGDHILATLNGHKVADFHDKTHAKGHIGLQTHAGDPYKNMKIMVRRVRLKRLGKGGQYPWLPKATNEYCNVCHVDFVKEELSVVHLKNDMACSACHGPSVEHMHDEQGMTRADIKFGRAEVDKFCKSCHGEHKNPDKVAAFRETWQGKTRPNGRAITAGSICTDCHGRHVVLKQTQRRTQGS